MSIVEAASHPALAVSPCLLFFVKFLLGLIFGPHSSPLNTIPSYMYRVCSPPYPIDLRLVVPAEFTVGREF